MNQQGGRKSDRPRPRGGRPSQGKGDGGRPRRHRGRPLEAPRQRQQPTSPRWRGESGVKVCRKCGGHMYPADWIWQKYGLCLGWRCANCKEKVMARSLPFKGLRKRTLDPDEVQPTTTPETSSDDTAGTT